MPEQPMEYADLNHAILVRDIGTTRLKNATTDAGATVFALAVRGDCACGAHQLEHTLLLTTDSAVGVIAQLTARMKQAGIPPDEYGRMLRAEAARLAGDDDTGAGHLVPGCPRCDRPPDRCRCDPVGAVR